MAARSAWSGAITFAGFPLHVTAYPLVSSKRTESFKTLDKGGAPMRRIYVDANGQEVPTVEHRKGVEIAKGQVVPLPQEAVDAIGKAEGTETVDPERFPPAESIPVHLASNHYRLVPNGKVPGSANSVNIIWNGLRKTKRALVIDGWVPKAGTAPALLVVLADEYGLNAHTLPYTTQLNNVPEHQFTVDDAQANVFEQFVQQNYSTDDFTHTSYKDRYKERREEIIAKAIAGDLKGVAEAEPAANPQAAPDLMAALEASLATPVAA